MKSYRTNIMFLTLFMVLSVFLFAGCRANNAASAWRDREVVIDGMDGGAEWDSSRNYFENGNVAVGLLNDEHNFYLRLSSGDPTIQRQIQANGITVWFDADGGKAKTLGIHFSTGMQRGGMPGGGAAGGGAPGGGMQRGGGAGMAGGAAGGGMQRGGGAGMAGGGGAAGSDNSGQTAATSETPQVTLLIVGPGENEARSITAAEVKSMGIEAATSTVKGNMTYELRIPLVRSGSEPYGIGTTLAKVIGIGLETKRPAVTPTVTQAAGPGGGGAGMPGAGGMPAGGAPAGGGGARGAGGTRGGGGGAPSGGGAPGGGMPGGAPAVGGMGQQTSVPVELWLKTTIATKP